MFGKYVRRTIRLLIIAGTVTAGMTLSAHYASALSFDGPPQQSLGTGTNTGQQSPTSGGADTSTGTTQAPTLLQGDYEYSAQPGDSLSLLVRRSLQLYDQGPQTLNPGTAMYCETHITQDMGSPLLEIGQHVSVPLALLQRYVTASKSLAPAEVAAWTPYADLASFDLSYIQPVTQPSPGAASQPPESSQTEPVPTPPHIEQPTPPQQAPQSPAVPKQPSEEPVKNSQKTVTTAPKSPAKVSNYWWLIGLGMLAAIYFVLGGTVPRAGKIRHSSPKS